MQFTPDSDQQAAEAITRLVDGTLSDAERDAVQAWADSRPEIAHRVLAHRRVAQELARGGPAPPDRLLEAIEQRFAAAGRKPTAASGRNPTAAAGRNPAPAPGRSRVAGGRTPTAAGRRSGLARGNWLPSIPLGGIAAAAAAAVAAVVIVIVIGVGGGGSSGPSIDAAARLAFVSARASAPAPSSAHYLDVSYGGVTFPNYAMLRAVPTGELTNRIGGRPALTVFYRLSNGARLSYTVFSGQPVPRPATARLVRYQGVWLHVYRLSDGLSVVTLVRHGRTCVLAARTVEDVVLGLAAEPVLSERV